MSETEAKPMWTSSTGIAPIQAEGCRHAAKIDCGICHAEEFERDMEKEEVVSNNDPRKQVVFLRGANNDLRRGIIRYKKALEDIGSYNGPSVILDIVKKALS